MNFFPSRKPEGNPSKQPPVKPGQKPARRALTVAEQAIEDAMARGDFDNLKGKGQPLKIEGDLTDRVVMSGKLRQNAGFGAPWEDVAREIEWMLRRAQEDFERARLRRSMSLKSPQADAARIEAQFEEAKVALEKKQIAAINSAILKHNLLLPPQLPALYKKRVSLSDFHL